MILPIHTYGDPILREQTREVTENSEGLQTLIDDMIETMHGAAGIGLAAPQVGRTERLFVVDLGPLIDEEDPATLTWPEQPMVFINPVIVEESDDECEYEEGCLSIPDLREYVARPEAIRVHYRDRNLEKQDIQVDDMLARVIQHEFDHLEGVLFIDRISPFRRRLLKRRLKDMAAGNVEAEYPLAVDPA
ncbi:MAG: peptide deformylase [Rhodothermales bacterium]|nr:peptide deformylase [Rhodothermales bacterium]MBO6781392.1 peptide deformylase [Rhodothermales bacterium]